MNTPAEQQRKSRIKALDEQLDEMDYHTPDFGRLSQRRFLLKWGLILITILLLLIVKLGEYSFTR